MRFVFGLVISLCPPTVAVADPLTEAAFDPAAVVSEDQDMIAFVGSKIFVKLHNLKIEEEIKKPDGTVVTRVIPNFDSRYEARYSVRALVGGTLDRDVIDFVAYDHASREFFFDHDPVLLFVVNHEDVWHHSKYLYYPVHMTTDGDWAICGNPARTDAHSAVGKRYMQTLTFLDTGEIPSDYAACTLGTRATDIAAFQTEIRFKPKARRRQCDTELGVPPNRVAGSGRSAGAKAQGEAHAACVAWLKAQDAF